MVRWADSVYRDLGVLMYNFPTNTIQIQIIQRWIQCLNFIFYKFFFRTGNSGKISMDELENSLAQIKEMLKKRSNIIDNLTPPIANDY